MGQGVSLWVQPPPSCPINFSSRPQSLLEPRALLLLHQELAEDRKVGLSMSFFPSCSSTREGRLRMLLGGVGGPLCTRHQAKVPGLPGAYRLSGILTKLGISRELQDLLILWGKETFRGCQAPAHQPLTYSLDPAIRNRPAGKKYGRCPERLRGQVTHLPGPSAVSGQEGS